MRTTEVADPTDELLDALLVAGWTAEPGALRTREPAGFTDVAVAENGAYAWQWGTGVAPAHRGHRLGMLPKASMVERLRFLEPALEVVATWNADSNAHMIAVNDALGYVPVDRLRERQLSRPG